MIVQTDGAPVGLKVGVIFGEFGQLRGIRKFETSETYMGLFESLISGISNEVLDPQPYRILQRL